MCASDILNGQQAVSEPGQQALKITMGTGCSCSRGNGDYQGCLPSDPTAIMPGMSSTSTTGRPHLVLVEPHLWYAIAPVSALEHRRELEDERSRLLALAVGDHLPIELAQQAADLTAQLDLLA